MGIPRCHGCVPRLGRHRSGVSLFGYVQLVINTATTVLTFLAVFLIQNTQNRNSLAVQIKLDELLRAVESARTGLVSLENATDEEIEALRLEFQRLHDRESENTKP